MFLILKDLHCSILHPILCTFAITEKGGKTFNLQPHLNPPRTYTFLDLRVEKEQIKLCQQLLAKQQSIFSEAEDFVIPTFHTHTQERVKHL